MFNAASASSPGGGRNCFKRSSQAITPFLAAARASSAIAFGGNRLKSEANVNTRSKPQPTACTALASSRIQRGATAGFRPHARALLRRARRGAGGRLSLPQQARRYLEGRRLRAGAPL